MPQSSKRHNSSTKLIYKVLKLEEEKQSSFKGFTNQFTLEPSGEKT